MNLDNFDRKQQELRKSTGGKWYLRTSLASNCQMLSCPNVSVCIWQVTEHVQFNSITCCYMCKLFNSNKESQIFHLSSSCKSFTSQLIM